MNAPSESLAVLQHTALRGESEAQFQLAIRYAHGRETAQDYTLAVQWFRRAADQGHAGAEDCLGVRYATGQGVSKDDREAVRWFKRAAERGYAVAQFNLGLASVHGQGLPQDYQQAYLWFSLAAAQGDEIAAESRERVAEALDWDELHAAKLLYHEACRRILRATNVP